jgi:hypothetical protein
MKPNNKLQTKIVPAITFKYEDILKSLDVILADLFRSITLRDKYAENKVSKNHIHGGINEE